MGTADDADALVDALCQRHVPASGEMRIVSLVPSLTELLVDLGLTDRLVGRTGFCIHPREAVASIPKMGGTKDVKRASIRAARPTHLIVNVDENRREDVEALRDDVPHIVVTHPRRPQDNPGLYRLFGALFAAQPGVSGRAARLQADWHEAFGQLGALAARLPRRRALYLIWRAPWMTVSRDTYIAAMLAAAGIDTVPAVCATRYPQVDWQAIREEAPHQVLLSSEPYAFRQRHVDEVERLAGCPARLIDGERVSWYGSRAIAGLRYLAAERSRGAL